MTRADSPNGKLDVAKMLDRIQAALAALEGSVAPERVTPVTSPKTEAREPRSRLRHNWG
jgi:hypothetical protein